jgi:hypothetical protein
MRIHRALVVVALLVPLAWSPALADPITVTFTAFPAPGDTVNLAPATGFFRFDSGLIPPGGGQVQDSTFGLGALDVGFTWGHTLYTTSNADIGELQFSPSGQLLAWVLGGTFSPSGVGGIYALIPNAIGDDFYAAVFSGVGAGRSITYTLASHQGLLQGKVISDSVPAAVAEPSSFLLLATGVAALRYGRRQPSTMSRLRLKRVLSPTNSEVTDPT